MKEEYDAVADCPSNFLENFVRMMTINGAKLGSFNGKNMRYFEVVEESNSGC